MKKIIFSIALLLGAIIHTEAQVAADALRFSNLSVGGTARTVGIGGSIGALGADFAVLSTNPAGIATYRSSEFTMTPSLYLFDTEATLDGSNNTAVSKNKTNFNFNNIGLVFAKEGRKTKWKTSNIAIGINRIANFHQKVNYSGQSTGSIIDFFQEAAGTSDANGLSDFTTGLAFDVGAIYQDDFEGTDAWETDVELNANALISKSQSITRSGSINELSFGMAGNLRERLMIGISLGIPILSYNETKEYIEDDEGDEVPAFRGLQFDEKLKVSGSGLNLKLGAILRISQMIRVGAAIHTPTTYGLEDEYETKLLHDFVDGNNDGRVESSSPTTEELGGPLEYNFRTPWRYIGSIAFLIKKKGFLSGEVEYVNYGGSKYDLTRESNNNADFENELNDEIANIYQSAINIRFGGEFAHKFLRFRGGVNLSGTPYAGSNIINNSYSIGLGMRKNKFFMDFAYRFATGLDDNYTPYSIVDSNFYPTQNVNTSASLNSALLTFGFKF